MPEDRRAARARAWRNTPTSTPFIGAARFPVGVHKGVTYFALAGRIDRPRQAGAGAASGAMIRGGKTSWRTLSVQRTGEGQAGHLDGAERLAALYRFQNGDVGGDHAFISLGEGRARVEVDSPADVDWDTFPVLAALEAVTRDELRRLRHVLRADPANHLVDEDLPSPTSSGTWTNPFFRAPPAPSPRASPPASPRPPRPAAPSPARSSLRARPRRGPSRRSSRSRAPRAPPRGPRAR